MELGEGGWSWVEVDGAQWSWVDVDGAEWSWVHSLVIPKNKKNEDVVGKINGKTSLIS